MSLTTAAPWLLHLALGGGVLLLLAWLLMRRVAEPARRQRLGEAGVLAALLVGVLALGPAWLPVSLPAWILPPRAEVAQSSQSPPTEPPSPPRAGAPEPGQAREGVAEEEVAPQEAPPAGAVAEPAPDVASAEVPWHKEAVSGPDVVRGLTLLYAALALLLLLRWLFAHAALAWLLRGARPAPARIRDILAAITSRRPRLLIAPRARVPFSCGLLRPTMVLPACLEGAPPQVLRWVLAHEQAHLDRRDGWTAVLLALGQAAFFYLPWFWWLRRQVRLSQEHVADAAAVAAGGRPEDYAELLLAWATAPRAPLAGHGVSGSSDLHRRVALLLRDDAGSGRGWRRGPPLLAGAGLLALAVILAGVRPCVQATAQAIALGSAEEKQLDRRAPPAAPKGENGPTLGDAAGEVGRDRIEALARELERQTEALRRRVEQETGVVGVPRLPETGLLASGLPGKGWGVLAGARLRVPEPALVAQLDLPGGRGLVLAELAPGSPAARLGLRKHDVLLELGGKPVRSREADFAEILKDLYAGKPATALVVRKGKRLLVGEASLARGQEGKRAP
jgi:beta-lactamase regulating signal transducer with metallopeptidase domain